MKAWVRRPVVEAAALIVLIALLGIYLIVLLQPVAPQPGLLVPNCPVPGADGRLPDGAPSFCHP